MIGTTRISAAGGCKTAASGITMQKHVPVENTSLGFATTVLNEGYRLLKAEGKSHVRSDA